ncbi:hypothetical protein ADUPG1_003548, partial [Aduncisulcus paluster]
MPKCSKAKVIIGYQSSPRNGLLDLLVLRHANSVVLPEAYDLDFEENELSRHPNQSFDKLVGINGFQVGVSMAPAIEPILRSFSEDIDRSRRKSIQPFAIELKNEESMRAPPLRRIPQCYKAFVKAEVEKLLASGIITPSKSWFHSPIVVVPKKGGKQ